LKEKVTDDMTKGPTDKQRHNNAGRARSLANLIPFRKGQSGNPRGRPKSITLSEAYRRELSKIDETDPERRTNAEVLAGKAILRARGGDVAALREIADRTEGRARQTVALTLERREQLEQAIAGIIREAHEASISCSREEAISTLAVFMPEVMELMN
jgi:hypothetical protein